MNVTEYLQNWADKYKSDLVNNILPFWIKNGVDRVNGGYYTCVDRDGTLYDSTKSVWFQGRFAFILSYAYNNIEKNPEWLAFSKSGIDFIENHCTDKDGRMFFEVSAEGTPLRKRRYLFSECFAAIAMAEYSVASGDISYAKKALDLFNFILKYKNTPGLTDPKYLPNVKTKGHSLCMILINTASIIRKAISDPILDKQIDESIAEIKRDFMKPDLRPY
jgi:N-acyl-D-glucosamine 2-epimerase